MRLCESVTPKWGYLVSGVNPQPLWVGEFGTAISADTCVSSGNSSDGGYWFSAMTKFVRDYGVDWSYWSINGTQSTGSGRTYGAPETYGVLNPKWNGSVLASLTERLQSMMNPPANLGFNLIPAAGGMTVPPGGTVNAVPTIVPAGGFTGTVNLSCSVSGGRAERPICRGAACRLPWRCQEQRRRVPQFRLRRREPWREMCRAPARRIGNLRRSRKSFLVAAMMFVASFAIAACGASRGGGSLPVAPVTVIGAVSGLTSVAAQISVTVQ